MSDAERLAGMVLCVPEQERPPVAEGEFYQSDLTGAELVDRTGRVIGQVTGWKTYGGPDLLEVKTESGKEILVPFARSICIEIDAAAKRIVADLPEGLIEL
jgi:16S rRNA processing protein RimM